uniref:Saposin B-type domain-containing protein n=1 Tax=Astatotilapia calliptera TaxID=8154 RepID=A0A3P8Q6D5_ASTCA
TYQTTFALGMEIVMAALTATHTTKINVTNKPNMHGCVLYLQLPGKCWACKWILNKVKKLAGPKATAESLKSKLLSICDEIGLLKSLCRKFVKVHLEELIEELTTICVNMGACKPREVDLFFYPKEGGPDTEIKEFQ